MTHRLWFRHVTPLPKRKQISVYCELASSLPLPSHLFVEDGCLPRYSRNTRFLPLSCSEIPMSSYEFQCLWSEAKESSTSLNFFWSTLEERKKDRFLCQSIYYDIECFESVPWPNCEHDSLITLTWITFEGKAAHYKTEVPCHHYHRLNIFEISWNRCHVYSQFEQPSYKESFFTYRRTRQNDAVTTVERRIIEPAVCDAAHAELLLLSLSCVSLHDCLVAITAKMFGKVPPSNTPGPPNNNGDQASAKSCTRLSTTGTASCLPCFTLSTNEGQH